MINIATFTISEYKNEKYLCLLLNYLENSRELIRKDSLLLINEIIEEDPSLTEFFVNSSKLYDQIRKIMLLSSSKYVNKKIDCF